MCGSSAAAVLLAVAIAGGVLADLQALAAAMACCAASDYECATLGAPDDCCQTMGHVGGTFIAAPPAKSIAAPAGAFAIGAAVVVPRLELPDRFSATTQAFKPPHSPPLLHRNPLRI